MIRVFISPSNAERLAAARKFAGSFAPGTEVLLVGASRDAVDHLARETSLAARATFGLHRMSVTQLAARLATAEFARQGLAHSTALGMEALAARVTFDAFEAKSLEYFGPIARRPGFARALARTLAELRLAGIRPAMLAAHAGAGGDLAEFLRLCEQQFERASIADRAALFAAAAGALKSGSGFGRMPALLLDLPVNSTAERGFIAALAACAPQVCATIPAGDDAALDAWNSIPGVERTIAESATRAGIHRLGDQLFSPTPPAERAPDDAVRFFSAPGEGRECVEIARRILDEARAGTPFDRVAILLRDPATYAGLVESALDRAHIPAFFARGTRRPDPAGRALLALLACKIEKLSARRFAEYLSLGQVPRLREDGKPPEGRAAWVPPDDESLGLAVDRARATAAPEGAIEEPDSGESEGGPVVHGGLRAPRRWERLLVEAAVVGGKERWARRLEGLEAEWRLKLEAVRLDEPDSPQLARLERDLAHLQNLAHFALPVIEALANFPDRATWGDWLAELEAFAPRVLQYPTRVLAILAELKPMSEVGPVILEEVRDAIAPRLLTAEAEPPPSSYGRVFICTPEDVRGRSFEVVFLPGLAERVFPRPSREDPLLIDDLRERLARDGDRLATADDRLQRERLLLRLAAGAATRRIHFSYPRLEVTKARQRVPSFYALEVARAATGRVPSVEELERDAALDAGAGLAWPAPSDPASAIDVMERDLAVLGNLLRSQDAAAVRGRARYLMELNPHLARSLRSRRARWRPEWSEWDGLCKASEPVREALAGERLGARPYSVSALQRFAVCPYQFLLSAIYRLARREESVPLERMDPLTRGHMFHRIQADLGRTLQAAGELPVSASNLDRALKVLGETVDRVSEAYREKLAPAILRVWLDEVDSVRTDLRAWLRWQVEHGKDAWQPIHFELGIGFRPDEGRDPASLADPVELDGGYKLHGFVDLIERRNNDGRVELRVTDHKTGRNRTRPGMVIDGGRTLQPVLYALAVELALAQRVVESRLFFCTTAGGFDERLVTLSEEVRRCGVEVLATIDRAIEQAFLPPAPVENACGWCDFREVCGPYEEVRVARKEPGRLAELAKLRTRP